MGEVGGSRHYQGAGVAAEAAWTCPACGELNAGPLPQGCQLCGAGAPGRRVVQEPPPATPPPSVGYQPGPDAQLRRIAVAFWEAHPTATVVDAFVAGYQLALAQAQAHTVRVAPPVAADIQALAPEQREQRTILAALHLFRDQILPHAAEEIQTGEFCSAQEVDALIRRIEESL